VQTSRAQWISTPAADLALAFAWVPFALVAHALEGDPDRIGTMLVLTFLLSFFHQPLTLPLVYGDPDQRRARPALFLWSPVLFVVAITIGMSVSVALVAIVAGLWNAEHTLMQRYGLVRIYGRKAGDSSGSIEKAMLVSWLVLAMVWVAADTSTPGRIAGLPLGTVNSASVDRLVSLQPLAAVFLVPAAVVALVLAGGWCAHERRGVAAGTANPAKWLYVASTAALFGWILVDPIAGFIGFVGAHSVEYFVIVHRAVGSRYADGSGGWLGAAVRRSRWQFFVAYVAVVAAVVVILRTYGGPDAYLYAVLFFGGLHVFYDGFIWKLRRPAVARGLVTQAPMPANVSA
jgi:hypothetical protein